MWDQVVSTWQGMQSSLGWTEALIAHRVLGGLLAGRVLHVPAVLRVETHRGRRASHVPASVARPSPCSSWASRRRYRSPLVSWEPSPSCAFVPRSKTRPRSAFYSSLSPVHRSIVGQLHAHRSALRGSLRDPGRQVAASRPGRGGGQGQPHALRRSRPTSRVSKARLKVFLASRLKGLALRVHVHGRRQGQPAVPVQAAGLHSTGRRSRTN